MSTGLPIGNYYPGVGTVCLVQRSEMDDTAFSSMNLTNDVWVYQGAGAPTSGGAGTGAGVTGKGSLYIDRSNGALYQNTNTKASPTWTLFESSGGVGSFTTLTATDLFQATKTGDIAAAIPGAPINNAVKTLFQVGLAIAGGNAAANGGTYIGGNAPAAGAGSAADWINLQANGTKVFGVDSTGKVTAGTYNKVTVTAPATGSTLTLADGKTLTASNTVTLAAGADGQTFTFPAASTTVAGLGTGQSFTATQTFNAAAGASLAVTGVANGAVNLGQAAVTQITSINTNVTLNGASGTVTTFNATTAAATWETGFTVTNSAVAANSVVVATVSDYSGVLATNGVPHVIADTVAAGSFHIRVGNLHGTNALNGTIKIRFVVL